MKHFFLKRSSIYICLLVIVTLLCPAALVAQSVVCPPVDQARLRLMDVKITRYLNDVNKFDSLTSVISVEHATELIVILNRIKQGLNGADADVLKPHTTSDDWARVRVILCPYLMQEPSSSSGNPEVPAPAIVFNNALYRNGDEIVVDYNGENYEYTFELRNDYGEGYRGWEVFKEDNTDVSTAVIVGFPQGASGLTLRVNAGLTPTTYVVHALFGPNRISVKFRRQLKSFEVRHLWAYDTEIKNNQRVSNPARKAKEGEKLYLVRSNNELRRHVNFNIETSAQDKDFWPNEPIWHLLNPEADNRDADMFEPEGNPSFERYGNYKSSYAFGNWSNTSMARVSVFGGEKDVLVQTLTQNKVVDVAVLPSPVQNAIDKCVKGFNKLGTWLSQKSGRNIEAKIFNEFAREQFNEQDNFSRHYFKVRQLKFSVGLEIATKFPIPGLNYKVPNVFEIGAYLKPSVELALSGGATDRMRSETTTWEFKSFDAGGSVTGAIEAGVTANIFEGATPGDERMVEFEVRGYAIANVQGQVDYTYTPSITPRNKLQLGLAINPLILGVFAKASVHTVLLDVDLFEYSREWSVTDAVSFQSEPATW